MMENIEELPVSNEQIIAVIPENKKPEPLKSFIKKPIESWWSSYRRDNGYLQTSNQTRSKDQIGEERFPKIYDSAKRLKSDARRICSFGCSDGSEIAALMKRFPNSEFVGIDINYNIIQSARNKNKAANVSFHDEIKGTGKYDLILCLMVLFSIEKPINKELWAETIKKLDDHINYGGVIMIYTSEYPILEGGLDPKKYKALNEWTREHNKNGKTYYSGYYQRLWW